MNPLPIQLLLTVLLGLPVLRILGAARTSQASRRRSLRWLLLWLSGLVAVWMPGLTMPVAHLLGVTRGVDAAVYLSVALLCYLVFRLYAALEKQDQMITRLVSELALHNPQLDAPTNAYPAPAASRPRAGSSAREGDSRAHV
jgi:small membrane protein